MTRAVRTVALLLGLALVASPVFAELEMTLGKSQSLDKPPLEITQSVSDGRLFVLLEGGEVQIFNADGQAQERFSVGKEITSLEVSPDGQKLYLGSRDKKKMSFLDLAFVQTLPLNSSAVKGADNASVTITVFDDFQCPYCARLAPTLDQVLATYPEQVRLVFKNFPLSMHKFAQAAAVAGIAARNQGKFWPLHDQMFANYNKLNDTLIRELAEGVGLDMERFDKDVASPFVQLEIEADMQLGSKAGVRGTPTVFINGIQVKDPSLAGFQKGIEAALAKTAK